MRPVDPVANSDRPRERFEPKPGVDAILFDPAGALLDRALGRTPSHQEDD